MIATSYKHKFTAELSAATNHCHSLALNKSLTSRCDLALDVACGDGDSTRVVSRVADNVIGIDSSKAAIKRAKRKNLGEKFAFLHTGFLEFESTFSSFDLISMSCSMVDLHEWETNGALHKMVRLLKPGGVICLVLSKSVAFVSDRQAETIVSVQSRTVTSQQNVFSLLRRLSCFFELAVWDVKSTLVNEFRLEHLQIESPFEIVTGRLRSQGRTSYES